MIDCGEILESIALSDDNTRLSVLFFTEIERYIFPLDCVESLSWQRTLFSGFIIIFVGLRHTEALEAFR